MSGVVRGRLCRCPELRLTCPGWRRIVFAMALMASQINDRATLPEPRRGLTRDEVMTASEVGDLLHLPVSTVYYLARRGELPACRLGRAWRFVRPRIEELLGS